MNIGILFIIIGGLMLLKEMGLIDGSFFSYLFPLLFIIFGIKLLKKKKQIDKTFGFDIFKMNGIGDLKKKNKSNHKVVDEQ